MSRENLSSVIDFGLERQWHFGIGGRAHVTEVLKASALTSAKVDFYR